MKTHILILLSALLLSAQPLHAQESGLDIRAGRILSFNTLRIAQYSPVALSVTYHKGLRALGVAADIPVQGSGAIGLQARAGINARGRLVSVNPFVDIDCRWLDGPCGTGIGYGASASIRIIGPLAIYTELTAKHDMHLYGNHLVIESRGRANLSAGIQLSI